MPRFQISKPLSEKAADHRSHLSQSIGALGEPVMHPCGLYAACGRECKVLIDSNRCGECVLLGRVYDLAVLPAALACVEEQFCKLRAEEKKATELKREVKA